MNKSIIIFLVIAAVGLGVYVLLGGSAELGQGVPEGAEITEIGMITEHGGEWAGREVTVKGRITQKCPTTGCWFYVQDDTGVIRVDTAPSGFTVVEVPANKMVTVHGMVVETSNGEAELVATGVKL